MMKDIIPQAFFEDSSCVRFRMQKESSDPETSSILVHEHQLGVTSMLNPAWDSYHAVPSSTPITARLVDALVSLTDHSLCEVMNILKEGEMSREEVDVVSRMGLNVHGVTTQMEMRIDTVIESNTNGASMENDKKRTVLVSGVEAKPVFENVTAQLLPARPTTVEAQQEICNMMGNDIQEKLAAIRFGVYMMGSKLDENDFVFASVDREANLIMSVCVARCWKDVVYLYAAMTPREKGKGHMRHLIEKIKKYYKERNMARMILECDDHSRAVWESLGFQPTGKSTYYLQYRLYD